MAGANFRRVHSPPSDISGTLGEYLRELARAINDVPAFSAFSGTTPNNVVTGFPGDIAVNLASASTDSRLFVKGGSVRAASQTGWVTIRIA